MYHFSDHSNKFIPNKSIFPHMSYQSKANKEWFGYAMNVMDWLGNDRFWLVNSGTSWLVN